MVALYFCSSIVLLLTGTRMGTFSLILTLWYVARIKSRTSARIWRMVVLAAALVVVANLIGLARFGEEVEGRSAIDPVRFIATQGVSLAVTEVAVMRRNLFQPYVFLTCCMSCKSSLSQAMCRITFVGASSALTSQSS